MNINKWNDNWKFWEMQDSFALIWNAPENYVNVKLPHDAMLAHKAHEGSNWSGNSGFRDGGHFCYSKDLEITDKSGKYYLIVDGAYENAAVFVNTQPVYRHPYGYTQFYVDLTPYLETERKNEIRIITTSLAPSCRWYPGGGLYRDVYLAESPEKIFLIPDGIFIKTIKAENDGSYALVEIRTLVKNDSDEAKTVQLKTVIEGLNNTFEETAEIAANETKTFIQNVSMENVQLWNEASPKLYSCKCSLFADEKQIDSDETRFGIRTLSLDSSNGLQVNGNTVKLRGACIHHDNGIIGAAEFKDAEIRKIKKLKEAGFNAIRTSHNPASRVLLEACDELGMFIMDESFDIWTRNKSDYDYANYFNDWWERDIEAMVQSAYNHPSVIIYSLGNEIQEIGTAAGIKVCKMLADKVKSLDDTRFTTVGINGAFATGEDLVDIVKDIVGEDEVEEKTKGNVNQFLSIMDQNMKKVVVHEKVSTRLEKADEVLDIVGYNYMTARYKGDVETYPDRIIVGSETYPSQIANNWNKTMQYPQIIGDFTWTGWDYLGEAGVGVPAYRFGEGGFGAQYPCQLAYVGDIDITGFRRPASYYREIAFRLRKQPYISVQDPAHFGAWVMTTPWVVSTGVSNWNYPGFEGKPIVVEVFSPGDETELFINGKTLGRKPVENYRPIVLFETEYKPGELKAVSYLNGEIIGEYSICTPDTEYHLTAYVEETFGGELKYIDLEYQDKNGNLVQVSDVEISVSVSGALESFVGSGNPKPLDNYLDGKTKLWNGRALLVIRKNNCDDKVIVKIESGKDVIDLEV